MTKAGSMWLGSIFEVYDFYTPHYECVKPNVWLSVDGITILSHRFLAAGLDTFSKQRRFGFHSVAWAFSIIYVSYIYICIYIYIIYIFIWFYQFYCLFLILVRQCLFPRLKRHILRQPKKEHSGQWRSDPVLLAETAKIVRKSMVKPLNPQFLG